MTYNRPLSVSFGPLHSGLVGLVGYQVQGTDGSVKISRTTDGITEPEDGSGLYLTVARVDPAWGFLVVLWSVTGYHLAAAQVFHAGDYSGDAGTGSGGVSSFDPGLPTLRDQVRFRVGDVSSSPQWFLADGSIDALLERLPFSEVCAQCAEAIGAVCIQLATITVQRHLRIQYQKRSDAAFQLADRIRNLALPEGAPTNVGAVSGDMKSPDLKDFLLFGPEGPRRA